MSDSKPLNWAYPFKAKAAEGENAGNATPELYQQALTKAKDGFYLLGRNGLWHGGVHFDDKTAGLLDQSAIHCIADGEIIAYRIDAKYPTSRYSDGLERQFSTGFVLVRHKLELPSVPATANTTTESEQTEGTPSNAETRSANTQVNTTADAPREALTFFSLYMHLMDWNSYELPDAPTPPPFMGDSVYSLKPDKATNAFTGLRVRSEPGGNVIALLPKGCKVRTGDAHATSSKWVELLEVIDGQASPALTGAPLGWVFRSEMDATGEADTYLIGEKANDLEPSLLNAKGLSVRKGPNFRSAEMGHLPVGAKIRLEAGTGAYRKLVEVVEGQSVVPHAGNSIHNINGYVHFESLQGEQSKPEVDSVQVLATPRPIKAGELIGHMGQYQNLNDAQPRSLLHLEVFSCEDVPAFIEKSRAVAQKLPADQKTLIKVHAGSSIKQPSEADTQIPAGIDVDISADSPKEGHWVKVQQYVVVKANKSELGGYVSATKSYPLNAAQKSALATKAGVEVSKMPDTADFLLESYDADGNGALPYSGGSIPATHPMRKVGIRLTGTYWIERSQLNAQGQRSSTAGSLQAWTEFPLTNANPGQESGYDYILSGASWADLPATAKAVAPDQTRWWYVTVGGKEGQDISGWVPEIDPIISKHSPWEWPGFTTIEDHSSLVSQCSRNLDATQCITGEEQQTYAAMIEQTERGPIFSKLYDIIDGQNPTGERDGKLTPKEIRTALEKPWLAQSISQIITHHESEWFWSAAKWNALDTLMVEEPGHINQDWEVEKKRIEKLNWWTDLIGQDDIAESGNIWHIHCCSIACKFSKNKSAIDVDKFIALYTAQHQDFREDTTPLGEQSKRNLEKLLNSINEHLIVSNVKVNVYELAYMLATTRHETYHYLSGEYFSEKPEIGDYSYFNKYDPVLASTAAHRKRAKENENTKEGDGFKYRGRGCVHLTWKKNYRISSEAIGVDFVNNPDLAADFKYAVQIMFWGMKSGVFTGRSLSDYINKSQVDYKGARRIINGQDEAELIASYARNF
ncbi:glycoside hydrolase family 19 protein [Ectopseudomonas mendocina]|uniref:Glycoside hydrolase family 19 protein n=1 Tax=Ectopseudomonas mendocina TaxID=300 RepID=A0ABZ2RG17_ECTME